MSIVQGGPKKTIPKLTKMIYTNIFGPDFNAYLSINNIHICSNNVH